MFYTDQLHKNLGEQALGRHLLGFEVPPGDSDAQLSSELFF